MNTCPRSFGSTLEPSNKFKNCKPKNSSNDCTNNQMRCKHKISSAYKPAGFLVFCLADIVISTNLECNYTPAPKTNSSEFYPPILRKIYEFEQISVSLRTDFWKRANPGKTLIQKWRDNIKRQCHFLGNMI